MVKKEKTKKTKGIERSNTDRVSAGLRVEASLFKLKKFVDNLVDTYSRATSIEPQEAKDIVSKKAASLMERGQYGRAIDELNRLINMGKEEPSIYYNLGICCEREDMDEEAEKAYKKAIEADKGFDDAYYRLGLLTIKNDDPKAAVKYLIPLTASKDASFDCLYQLGVAYDKLKDHEKAIESFKKAISVESKYPKAYKRLGYAFDAAGKHEEAVQCFKKAMELEEI